MSARQVVSPIMILALAALGGCAVGPRYVRPAVETPPAFKEFGDWRPAAPADGLARGTWWRVFGDSVLDRLEAEVEVSSNTLAVAVAQYRQALALAGAARAGLFPSLDASASASRGNTPSSARSASGAASEQFATGLAATWELDLWGRLRRSEQASRAAAQASAADLESARLSLHAMLAQSYFSLRNADADIQLIDRITQGFEQSLRITKNQYSAGVAARSDVDAAETQLKSAQAQGIDLSLQRAQFEHAIAVLLGRPPAYVGIAPVDSLVGIPAQPPVLPSELLERRPDIAAAERRLAAASAGIGVARSGYFPTLTLGGSAGYQGSVLSKLISVPNEVWALGTSLLQTLFDAGKTRAGVAQARAVYDEALANYRQAVLVAFQDVEDQLAAIRILQQEASVQDEAVAAARRSLEHTLNQYKAGTVSHLNVITAQAALLTAERTAVDLSGRRLNAVVSLFKATGGGWTTTLGDSVRGHE